MKSNTEFNKYKVKNDELYLPKSGGKVEGETVFTGGVRFSSGDPKNDLVIKDKRSLGTATGHEYDLEFNNDLDEVTLTEDSIDKTTLPLVATFVGTRAEWNNLSAAEQAKYRHIIFTDETGSDDISGKAITYTSSDTTDANSTSWTSVSKLTSGLSLTTLFARMSQMFKNVRYLYKTLIDETTISTTEKYIGTYNGTSLYRKLIELTYAASSGTSHTLSLASYGITGSNVKRMYGYAEGDANYGSFLTFPCYYNSNAYIQSYINKNNNTLYITKGTQYNNNPLKIHLIIEYTK